MRFKILICDVNIKLQGHYISYNQYLIDNINEYENSNDKLEVHFLYNNSARDLLKITQAQKEKVHFLDNSESKNSFFTRHAIYKKVIQFCKDKKIDYLIFMDLERYQFFVSFYKIDFRISGIVFRPHHRIASANKNFKSVVNANIKLFKKKVAEKLLLKNKNVKHLFVLNDKKGVDYLNRVHQTTVFRYLPDPIFTTNAYSEKSKEVPNNTPYKFLIFGAINERKNITNIIKAYAEVDFKRETELVIAGPGKDDYLRYLNLLITSLGDKIDSSKKITIKEGFCSDEEMNALFYSCDVCLVIYKNFFASSGVLGTAVTYKKKVIAPNVGLLAELVQEYELGITCDPTCPSNISEALFGILAYAPSRRGFDQFYTKHTPKAFLQELIKN